MLALNARKRGTHTIICMMSKTKGNQNSSNSAYDQQNGVREGLDLELDFQENSKVGKTYLIVKKKL
jgi:hypothetical protein